MHRKKELKISTKKKLKSWKWFLFGKVKDLEDYYCLIKEKRFEIYQNPTDSYEIWEAKGKEQFWMAPFNMDWIIVRIFLNLRESKQCNTVMWAEWNVP